MPRTRSLAWAELKIGLVSIFALVMASTLVFLLSGSGGFFWQRYSIKTVFSNIAGLKEGAPVRVAGVEVGSVNELNFIGDHVEVVMQVKKEHQQRITTTSVASLGSVSLLGEAAVDITIAHQLREHHPLIDAVTDQSQREVYAIRFDLRREPVNVGIFIHISRCVEKYRTGLIERVGLFKRRVTDENSSIDSGHERLE